MSQRISQFTIYAANIGCVELLVVHIRFWVKLIFLKTGFKFFSLFLLSFGYTKMQKSVSVRRAFYLATILKKHQKIINIHVQLQTASCFTQNNNIAIILRSKIVTKMKQVASWQSKRLEKFKSIRLFKFHYLVYIFKY